MLILPEIEGYTPKTLGNVVQLFEKCGIEAILNHGVVAIAPTRIPIRDIADEPYGPIQPNIAYFFCKFESPDVTSTPPIIKSMISKNRGYTALINMDRYFSLGFDPFPWDKKISKDITFISKVDNQLLGWYNSPMNILWVADLGNYENTAQGNIRSILEVILRFKKGIPPHNPITIGCDPEFEITNSSNELIPANTIFSDPNHAAQIGVDGHAATGELRPAFSTNPIKLSRNIKRLLRKINNNHNFSAAIKVQAGGGTQVTTGGHLHFGIATIPDDLKDILWDYVANPVLKVQGSLRKNDKTKTVKNGGDVTRRQPWGMEWRPLPSFIVNEDITKSVLCTAYAFVKSYFNGGLPDKSKNIYYKLPLYSAYKKEIDKFIELFVAPIEQVMLENRDVLKEWKLSKLDKKSTVTINCPIDGLGKLFTPLNIKLSNPVRFGIYVGEDTLLYICGVPKETTKKFKELAKRHYVAFRSSREREHGYGKLDHMYICLPYSWKIDDYIPEFFAELKDLIKEAILEYDKGTTYKL